MTAAAKADASNEAALTLASWPWLPAGGVWLPVEALEGDEPAVAIAVASDGPSSGEMRAVH